MNLFSPAEVIQNYADAGGRKASLPLFRMLALGVLAGMLIAMGSAAVNTAVCTVENPSTARLISGLLFPFGLGVGVLSGAELFTGNCLLCISVYERRVTPGAVARSLLFVYLGNLAGALLVAAGCVYSGQLGMAGGWRSPRFGARRQNVSLGFRRRRCSAFSATCWSPWGYC